MNSSRGSEPEDPSGGQSPVTNYTGDMIPRHQIVWALLVRLGGATLDLSGFVLRELDAAGFDHDSSGQLAELARTALAEDRQYEQEQMRGLCAGLRPDADAQSIAARLEKLEQAVDSWQEKRGFGRIRPRASLSAAPHIPSLAPARVRQAQCVALHPDHLLLHGRVGPLRLRASKKRKTS
jgi:hypothetical protein